MKPFENHGIYWDHGAIILPVTLPAEVKVDIQILVHCPGSSSRAMETDFLKVKKQVSRSVSSTLPKSDPARGLRGDFPPK